MTALVLLGAAAVLLGAGSVFIVGVAVGFGIARRRYAKRRPHDLSPAELLFCAVAASDVPGDFPRRNAARR